MQRLHHYPDINAMFRRLLLACIIGVLAALAVSAFRHAMLLLEWLFLSNDSGSLVNAAEGLSGFAKPKSNTIAQSPTTGSSESITF